MAGDAETGENRKRGKVRKTRAFCARCKHQQSFEMITINHRLHFLLTILTGGLWGISWLAHTLGMTARPWRCKHCGWQKPESRE